MMLLPNRGVSFVLRAMDLAAVRHRTVAHNIANADTPGFRPRRISFKEALAAEWNRHQFGPETPAPDAGSLVEEAESAGVSLDREIAELSENTLFFSALTRLVQNDARRMETAIRGR